VFLAFGTVVLYCLFSTYDQWNAAHYGNRFLMPIVAFAVVPLATLLDQAAGWLRLRRSTP